MFRFSTCYPCIQAVGDPEALYLVAYDPLVGDYMGDIHPSRYGNRVAAKAVAQMLIAEGLIPLDRSAQSVDN